MERNTLQKSVIYDTVMSMDHPSADEVYGEISVRYPAISRATVFRVLNGLAESGRINKICMPDTSDRYDRTLTCHSHIVCRKCKRVSDVATKGFSEIENPPENLSGYLIEYYNVTYSGLCPECKINGGE